MRCKSSAKLRKWNWKRIRIFEFSFLLPGLCLKLVQWNVWINVLFNTLMKAAYCITLYFKDPRYTWWYGWKVLIKCVTPIVVGNIVSDKTAFCSHHAVAWTEGTTVAWVQIFDSRHSEISKSILKFLANPMVIQLKSYHLPIVISELSSGTAQS